MKTRDKVKYVFATFLALATCAAIVAMVISQQRRQNVPTDERQRIRQTLTTYGQLPVPVNSAPGTQPATEPAPPAPTPLPQASDAPVPTPISIPAPVAIQHGATQVDPATRP